MRARQRLARQERLVALDVHDGVERGELGARGDFGNTVGAGEVTASVSTARTPDRSTTCATSGESVATTSSSDQTMLQHTLDDPGDQRLTCQHAGAVCWGGGWSRDEPE